MCLCVQNHGVLFSSASLVMRIWVLYLSMRGGATAGKVSREGSHPESPLRYPLEAQSMMRGTPGVGDWDILLRSDRRALSERLWEAASILYPGA